MSLYSYDLVLEKINIENYKQATEMLSKQQTNFKLMTFVYGKDDIAGAVLSN